MTTEWIIERLDAYPEHQGETDVVCTVYWRANTTEEIDGKSFFATAYGTVGVTIDPEDPFTPYDQLTKEQVLEWVWASVDKESAEASLASQIEEQKNPKVISKPLPW